MPPSDIKIARELIELLEPTYVLKDITARVAKEPSLSLLDKEAQKRGYKALVEPTGVIGQRYSVRTAEDVLPPKDVKGGGAPFRDLVYELLIVSYVKANSKDQAALIIASLKAGDNIDTTHVLLEAPGGKFDRAKEWAVKSGAVVPMKSWWSAVRACLKKHCGPTCAAAVIVCGALIPAAWWACFAAACGGCLLWCAACATCNCKWRCRAVFNCCRQ